MWLVQEGDCRMSREVASIKPLLPYSNPLSFLPGGGDGAFFGRLLQSTLHYGRGLSAHRKMFSVTNSRDPAPGSLTELAAAPNRSRAFARE